MTSDEKAARRREKRAVQEVEDRVTGMLVRFGVAYEDLEAARQKVAERLAALSKTHALSARDVEYVVNIVLKEPKS
jgi:hypothetical protein